MPYNSNEQLEREARESLVASDLSAKMKQWRDQSPPPKGGGMGASPLGYLLLLLALGGAAWLFWPNSKEGTPGPETQPSNFPAPEQSPTQEAQNPAQEPIAQISTPPSNRYLALAQSQYKAPDFKPEIRGSVPVGEDLLNNARQALVEHRYADALKDLQNISAEYKTDAAYLRGHALFGLKKYAQAAVLFGQLTGSIRYGEAAEWFEVLSLLPDFEQNKSLVLNKLKKIVGDQEHPFHQEANVLYRKL